MRGEYTTDDVFDLPLFAHGPEELSPPRSPANDPPSALAAASSPEARRAVRQGTARCLLLLLAHPDGLTDYEAIEKYRLAHPEEIDQRGIIGFVRTTIRNWCLLKPNDDTRNRKHENLALIERTAVTRKNPYSSKDNAVFQFIHPPSDRQIQEWTRLAYGIEE